MTPPTATTSVRPRSGRARISEVSAAGTELVVETTSASTQTQLVPAVPDPVRADRVIRSVDRLLWQRLASDCSHGVVAGVRRRRPVYLSVSPSTALGLLDAGLPTVVDGGGPR